MTKWKAKMWRSIRGKRKKRQMSMRALAQMAGCSEAQISRIERGLVTANPAIMDRIHEVLGI